MTGAAAARPSYAVDVEPGTGLIIRPSRARSRPAEVEFMRVRWQSDIPGVLAWLRTLNVQHIVHTETGGGNAGPTAALTLFLRYELHTALFGDALVLPPGGGTAAHRMRILSREDFDSAYTLADRGA